MPIYRDEGPFQIDPKHDEEAYRELLSNEVRDLFHKRIQKITEIDDVTIQKHCVLSMIDCLAQEWGNYSQKSNREIFCQFVLRYQTICDVIDRIEPVTLFYRVEDSIEVEPLLPGFPPEQSISLDELGCVDNKDIHEVMDSSFAQRLIGHVNSKYEPKKVNHLLRDHTLVNLIYQMRNKIVHEFYDIGGELKFEDPREEPYYREAGNLRVFDDRMVSYESIEFVIPVNFLIKLLKSCIDGYLFECEEKECIPFENRNNRRNLELRWYNNSD